MSRPVAPPLVWESIEDAERAGPYTVQLAEAHQWQLVVDGATVGVYPTKTGARNAAVDKHRRRGIRRRLTRHLLVGTASLIVLLLALSQRIEPNPDFPGARAVADRFDVARLAVEAGEVSIEEVGTAFEGISGAEFQHALSSKLGLAGVFDEQCYGIVWRSGFEPSGVALRNNYVTCAPDPTLIVQPDPPGLTAELMWPTWKEALPDEERSPVWFLPAFILGFGVFFGSFIRGTALLLTVRR